MSSLISLDQLEYIEDLRFKDNHFLDTVFMAPMFVEYQIPTQLAQDQEAMRKNTLVTK